MIMPKFDKFNTKIIFLMILSGVLLISIIVSVSAFVLCLISLGLGLYISPKLSDYIKANKEKEIKRLEKRLADLRSEVI